jgi:hypothetical protein
MQPFAKKIVFTLARRHGLMGAWARLAHRPADLRSARRAVVWGRCSWIGVAEDRAAHVESRDLRSHQSLHGHWQWGQAKRESAAACPPGSQTTPRGTSAAPGVLQLRDYLSASSREKGTRPIPGGNVAKGSTAVDRDHLKWADSALE